jgi:hypothetical protein
MSSSFRNRAALVAGVALAAGGAREAAAQTYFVPRVEVSSEYHTNRELTSVSAQEDATTGYIANMQALIGKRTPRSQTEIRPRLRFQEYPDRSGVDPVDGFFDLQSEFRTLNTTYSVLFSASRQDTFNAEFGDAVRDTTGPETPPENNDTGIVFVGNARTEFNVEPTMEHKISERMSLGATLEYDKVDYEQTSILTRQDYTNYSAQALLKEQLSPLSNIQFGPYVSRYEAADDSNTTDGAGLGVTWNYDISEISHTKFGVQVERTKIDAPAIFATEVNQTNWGAEFSGYRKGRASRFDYAIGRYLAASGIGSKTRRSEARVQYSRALSPRFSVVGAVRGGQEQRLGLADNSRDRNYIRSEFSMRFSFTRTLYLSTGYRYARQKYKDQLNPADDNAAFLLFGYNGLDIRRSAVRGGQ